MKRFLLIAALIAAPAYADLVVSNGANELRLMPESCTNPAILERIKDEYRPQFKKAQASIDGKTFAGCWIDTQQGAYYVLYSDGGEAAYPVTAFIEAPGA